jgi:diketogulonate reductase-like aldo/keto reductase
MKFHTLPTGEKIPYLGFGTWRLGGTRTPDYSQDQFIIDHLKEAIRLGFSHIDTAEMYAGGHTEELIGSAIQQFDRSTLLIATKVWQSHLQYKDVFEALNGSLRRLKTDYVDIYSIHLPSPHIPLTETFRALNELVSQGKIRHIGLSNFNVQQAIIVEQLSDTPIVMIQAPASLYNKKFIKSGLLQHCQDSGLILAAYSPFERGEIFGNPHLEKVAQKYHASPAQIALRWLLHMPNAIVYLMSLNLTHLQQNLDALDIDIAPEDFQLLDQLEMPEDQLFPI